MPNFKYYYRLPLTYEKDYSSKVFTADSNMAFDFAVPGLHESDESIFLSPEDRVKMVQILNGQLKASVGGDIVYDPTLQTVMLNGKMIIDVRGWGMLTGGGGYGLEPLTASKIMDDFGNWIADTLSGKIKN